MSFKQPVYRGSPTLCLRTKDLEASRRFYEALGMEVVDEVPDVRVILRNGNFSVALMTFLDENLLNFRGTDVFAVYDSLKEKNLDLEGKPERYTREQHDAGADGESWSTKDPDGNVIFFDTNRNEQGEAFEQRRLSELLRNTEQELLNIGASAECLQSFRTEILAKYAP